ncbi:3-deoxy-7-phosphoheptulonate synthase, partial [Candidatus Peregrinibacteria bacterium CG11_big_fil_rev_8_21_14_0_20_46_8]
DGIMVEAHPNPIESQCDSDQALSMEDLSEMIEELGPIAKAIGRNLATL